MPRHWWILVGSSDAGERKKEVRRKLKEKKKKDVLHSFWKTPDGSLYAIVQADDVDDVWKDIDGKEKMEMEDVPG